ncbi:hypothetical protein NGRA_0721 [Nosema granulosis]|uniref:Uncharacterized protein n=1 Tax=Nosema granulosis TaxID=83296 RepID=A0A9P6H1H1_9MICR|nr:hypothetical protein NGRA_0721 [Nosema granulosis]
MYMDDTYDANFGEWIRNEDNSRIVAYNMKKYIDSYSVSNVIVVIKWIVKDWTLKSIIIFTKKMLIEDIKALSFREADCEKEKYYNRIRIASGLIYTWNPLFISEFILSTTKHFSVDEKTKFLKVLLDSLENKKLNDVLSHLNGKMDNKVRQELTKEFNIEERSKRKNQSKRSDSMIEAYNVS